MHQKKRTVFICLFLAILFLAFHFSYGQRLTGTIRGTVKDDAGEPLPGVTVEIQSPDLIGGVKSALTSESGVFLFAALPPGIYKAAFTLSGFQSTERENLVVSIGKTVSVDIVMKPAALEEKVTVVAESPVVDVTKSGLSSTYDINILENVPKSRFTYMDIMFWAPGVSMNETSTEEWHSSLGSAGWSDNYLVDGVDTSFDWNGTTWVWNNPDIYEEGEVLTIGTPAEYGDFQGAVVNVVTKSGGNDFQTGLYYYTIFSDLVDNNVPEAEYPFSIQKSHDLSFEISGPLKRDKIWYYANGHVKRYDYSQLGTPPDFPTKSAYDRIFVKATFQLAKNHRLMVSYQHEWSDLPDVVTPSQPFGACAKEPGEYGVPNILLTSILSQNTIFDLKIGGWIVKDNWKPMDNNLDEPCHFNGATGEYRNGIWGWGEWTYTKLQVNASLSHFADDFIKGNHEFKFGVQFNRGSSNGFWSYSGGVVYYDYDYYNAWPDWYPYAAYFQQPYNYGSSVVKLGAFIDDAWAITDRLTLNLGVRFDHQSGNIMEVDEIDVNRNETGNRIEGIDGILSWNDISPRLGFVYQLTADRKTTLRVNYGHYYDGMTLMTFARMTPSATPVEAYLYNWDTGVYDIPFWTWDPTQGNAIGDVKNSLCQQFSFGLTRELLPDLALELTFVYKHTKNFYSWWNTAAQYEQVDYFDEYSGQTIQVWNQTTPVDDDFFTLINPPEYKQKYRGLILGIQKRLTNNWQMSASFVWSKANGVSNIAQIYQGSRNGIQNPNQLINNNWDSLLQSDRTYMVKIQGSYFFPLGFSVSVNYAGQTGKPISRIVPILGLDQGAFQIMGEPRGATWRLDSTHLLDLRIEKRFNFTNRFNLRIAADFFNILNTDAITQTIDIGTSPYFLGPDAIVAPRRIQIAFRISY